MTPETSLSETIRIGIAVPDDLRSSVVESHVIDCCGAYLKELLQSLELPDGVEIDVTTPAPLPDFAGIRLTIQETPVTIWTPHANDEESLIQVICSALFRCRTLIIDDNMVKRLWLRTFSGFYPELSGDCETALLGYCRKMVQHGKKPELPSRWNNTEFIESSVFEDEIELAIEEAMAREPLSICLYMNQEHYARCFDNSGNAMQLPDEEHDFSAMIRMMNDGLFWELGIVYLIQKPMTDPALSHPWFRIKLNEIRTPPLRGLRFDEFLVNETVERLEYLNIEGITSINPANGMLCARVEGGTDVRQICHHAGLTTWGPEGFMVLCASSEIRRNAGALVSHNLIKFYAAQLSQSFPELVNQVLHRFGVNKLTQVLRLLMSEELSIRDLRSILEAMLSLNSITTADMSKNIVFMDHCGLACPVTTQCALEDLRAHDIADCVRMAMKRSISRKFSRGSHTMVVYLLSPSIEERLRDGISLSSEERRELLDAVGAEIANSPLSYQSPVILTNHDVRRPLQNILKPDFPYLAVLSYQEISPDMNIQPIARIESVMNG